MRSYFSFLILICYSLVCFTGCNKQDDAGAPQTGVIFNPIKPYQESLPGQIISFKFKVASRDSVTGFGLRFLFPGATNYVALPEYPDLTNTAKAFTAAYQTFEYAIPGSATAANTNTQIKFIATTATQSYQSVYTIKMLSIGLQRARLYSTDASTYFRFNNVDLLRAVGTPTPALPLTQDMTPTFVTLKNTITNQTFNSITGWTSGNGTKFKLATAANYNLAQTQYATIYAGIAASGELSSVTTLMAASPLTANQYYIAKVNRNGVFSYVGILVKKGPTTTVSVQNSTVTVDLTQEYIELEIKNK
jgi:hypothetical protein